MTTTTSGLALQAVGLRKSFGTTVALDGVDRVNAGAIFALAGYGWAMKALRPRPVARVT